mmetsp:Transcript_33473/g.68355  ORF Transcript_33473/g.68355 Transcript_33473/m.68355 type:complete len:101 (+) Transcript_33473:455-757(+)
MLSSSNCMRGLTMSMDADRRARGRIERATLSADCDMGRSLVTMVMDADRWPARETSSADFDSIKLPLEFVEDERPKLMERDLRTFILVGTTRVDYFEVGW